MYVVFSRTGYLVTGLFSDEFRNAAWSMAKFVDMLKNIWLPLVVLAVTGAAGLIRILRATLLDELKKQYVTTARAKGLPEWRVILLYPIRIAINPIISTIGWMLLPPAVWLVWAMGRGAVVNEYPYPILDAHKLGYGPVTINILVGLIVLMLLFAGTVALDRYTGLSTEGRMFSGVADFGGDLKDELITRDPVTGAVYIDGDALFGAPTLALNWKLSATGDFDADGKADLLWRNTTSQKLLSLIHI